MNKTSRVILLILAFIASYLTFAVGGWAGSQTTGNDTEAGLYVFLGIISFFVALYLTLAKNQNKTVVTVLGLFILISFLAAYFTRIQIIEMTDQNGGVPIDVPIQEGTIEGSNPVNNG